MKPKEFTIDRATWRFGGRGEEVGVWAHIPFKGSTKLLNFEGEKCCLGFYANACGISDRTIMSKGTPSDLSKTAQKKLGDLRTYAPEAMVVNDYSTMTTKDREAKIKELFKQHGVKVKFTGRYPKKVKDFFDNR